MSHQLCNPKHTLPAVVLLGVTRVTLADELVGAVVVSLHTCGTVGVLLRGRMLHREHSWMHGVAVVVL